MVRIPPVAGLIVLTLLLGAATLLMTAATHGLSPSLIEPDEGGHYVNALFLGDWLRAGLPAPIPFAKDFYAHFPRLTIGHWPPGWYMLETPLFALFRPSPFTAACISAFLAGLPGVAILWAFRAVGHGRIGLILGAVYCLMPIVLDGARYVLVDQPLALVVTLATIAWAAASAHPDWRRMLVFALLAAACPLVKGNGALVALIPPIDIALTGRWRLLRQPALWGAAMVALAIVTPWYIVSFTISAEGFNYAPGPSYTWLALSQNIVTILANVGVGGIVLAGAGVAGRWLGVPDGETRMAQLALAVVLATLIFQAAVPASLAARYMAPMLPWLTVLGGLGVVQLARRGAGGRTSAAMLAVAALWPALTTISALKPKPDIGAPRLAEEIARRGGIWLVDGSSGAEGALIAAAAYRDQGRRQVWIARASQWLSSSDFMGRGYQLTATSPAAARGVLDRLGAAGMVSVAPLSQLAYPHGHILIQAVRDPSYQITERAFDRGKGAVLTATRITPVRPAAALLATDSGSAKVGKMVGAFQ